MEENRSSIAGLRKSLAARGSPAKAQFLQRFFKTGKGEYAEGDRFIGVTVPVLRKIGRENLSLADDQISDLVQSPIHEERLLGLLIWVYQAEQAARRGNVDRQREIAALYLRHRKHINNWDLVDVTCPKILGPALGKSVLPQLRIWASDPKATLWEKRIAIIATFHFIRLGNCRPTLELARILISEKHDLLQKATGWMLREVGKRCGQEVLESFLREHHSAMGRTCLRYAIERFPENLRKKYLHGFG